MFLAGLDGQPVDIYKYYEGTGPRRYNLLVDHRLRSCSRSGILTSSSTPLAASTTGVRAGHDPWGGTTLEWFALSPPPPHNFDVVPDVRSPEPLRDIRDAIQRRTRELVGAPAAARAARPEPAAPPAGRIGRPGDAPGSAPVA